MCSNKQLDDISFGKELQVESKQKEMTTQGGEAAGKTTDLSEMMQTFMEDWRQQETEMPAQV